MKYAWILLIVGFVLALFVIEPPTCPANMSVGDMIEHRAGTQGVLLQCEYSGVKVSTGENHRFWNHFELADQ